MAFGGKTAVTPPDMIRFTLNNLNLKGFCGEITFVY